MNKGKVVLIVILLLALIAGVMVAVKFSQPQNEEIAAGAPAEDLRRC